MTDQDRLAELEQVVAAQSRLLAELFAMIREEDLRKSPLMLSTDQGQELLDTCLGDIPHEAQNRWFGQLLGYFDHRRPLHDRP